MHTVNNPLDQCNENKIASKRRIFRSQCCFANLAEPLVKCEGVNCANLGLSGVAFSFCGLDSRFAEIDLTNGYKVHSNESLLLEVHCHLLKLLITEMHESI